MNMPVPQAIVALSSNAPMKINPTRLSVLVLDQESGRPLRGIPLAATVEKKDHLQIALGLLATDHAGYASFSLKPLELVEPPSPVRPNDGPVVTFDLNAFLTANEIRAILVTPFGNAERAVNALKSGKWREDALLAQLEIPAPLPAQLRRDLPSMQEPGLPDWWLSPGSFSISPSFFVGEDECEQLFPANFATQVYRFRQLVVDRSHELGPAQFTGYVNEYTTSWIPLGHSLGEIVYSLPLAPCESIKIAVIDWSRRDDAARNEDLTVAEQLTHNQRRDRAIEEAVHASLREWQSGESGMFGVAGGISAGINIMGALGAGFSVTRGGRDLEAKSVQKLSDSIVQTTTAVRKLNSTVIVQSSQAEREHIQTRTVANHNHCHALTILYYEIMRHYRVVTQFAGRHLVIFVRYERNVFGPSLRDAEATMVKYRLLLERVLLDERLRGCLDALDRWVCFRQGITDEARRQNNSLAALEFFAFKVEVLTGWDESVEGDLTFDVIQKGGIVRPCQRFRFPRSIPKIADFETNLLPNELRKLRPLSPAGRYFSFMVTPVGGPGVPFSSLEKLVLKFTSQAFGSNQDKEWALGAVRISGMHADGETLLHFDIPDLVRADGETYEVPLAPPQLITEPVTGAFSQEDRCCLERLRQHLVDNAAYYDRAIWLMEDPNERARERFAAVTVGGVPILDVVENRALEVIGDLVAFPMSDVGAETDPDVLKALRRHKAEELLSFPVRGVFAEAKLGHCNSCEEMDITRFWDWTESPCPEAPDIAPVQPVTPGPQQPNLQPSSLPNSIVNIVNPPGAPDPVGLAAALNLLGTPNIFRDMSGRQELGALLGQLAGGTVDLAKAQQKARDILGSQAAQDAATAPAIGTGLQPIGKLPPSDLGKLLPQIQKDPNLTDDQKTTLKKQAYRRGLGLPDDGAGTDRALNFDFRYQIGTNLSRLDGEFDIRIGDPFNKLVYEGGAASTTKGIATVLNPRVEPGGPITIDGSPRSPIAMGPDLMLNFGSVIGSVAVPLRRFLPVDMPVLAGSLGTWNFAAGKRIANFEVVAKTVTTVIEVEIDISVTTNLGVKVGQAVEAAAKLEGLVEFGLKPTVNLEAAVNASVGGKVKIPFEATALAPNTPLEIKQTA